MSALYPDICDFKFPNAADIVAHKKAIIKAIPGRINNGNGTGNIIVRTAGV